ncbi:MAG: DNA ligase D, partial [Pirellulales bacterium]
MTSEPRGGRASSRGPLRFVIQKHDASHLHYDFRLELDGVLKSWAVPKGPSLDPSQKRLAMHVEDHPIEYGTFEGIIPQGEYGGGTVLLWDQGTWEPIGDAKKGLREGALKFALHGEKLRGRWMIVRRGGKRSEPNERTWFLFKERDEFADPAADITAAMPLSVTTGRDLDEIAQQADRVWGSKGEVKGARKSKRIAAKQQAARPSRNGRKQSAAVAGNGAAKKPAKSKPTAATRAAVAKALKALPAKRAPLPATATVQLATLTKEAPTGDEWLHEIKFDGYRMLCRIEGGKATFISRNGHDWTAKFPDLGRAAAALPVTTAILDGEVVAMQPDGTTSFQSLQNAFQTGSTANLLFFVFDLLYLDGYDVRALMLEDRKSLLRRVVPDNSHGAVRFSDHVVGKGPDFFDQACRMHLEGIISKRRQRPYVAGRGVDWLKVKCSLSEEFVIGGFTTPSGARSHFGALLVGYYDTKGQLVYAGRVGTGFDNRTLADLHAKLAKLEQPKSPFVNLSGSTGQARGVTWVKPKLVAQVTFSNWTDDRQLRHPSFQGLREDKDAREVTREEPVSQEAVESSSAAKNPRPAKAAKASSAATEVAGVQLSNPGKLLYPQDGITKLDLARYYEQVAEWMLPHVANRLLSLVRCPAGSGQKCFFQKHPGEGASEHLARYPVREKNKTEEYLAIHDLPGVIALVQMGVLEIHVWGSLADEYEKPDRLIIDLDPDPAVEWPQVVAAAKEVRLLLEELKLVSFLKTTGGKGLHVVVPIRRTVTWDEAKEFCRAVADHMVAAAPDRYIA